MRIRSVVVFGLMMAVGLGAGSVALAADPYVNSELIDLSTGGDWPGTYGECFFLLPWPQEEGIEDPGWDGYNTCSGGTLPTTWSLEGAGDPGKVFVWALTLNSVGDFRPQPGAEQYNPCLGDYFAATFDNGDLNQGIFDPLTNELVVADYTGCLTVAYYFSEEYPRWCREQEYVLSVNGTPLEDGIIDSFSSGKYVVFEICGLAGESIITFDVQNTGGMPCGPSKFYPNTHLSGGFISDCEVDEVCAGTPGYYKKASHWPEGVDEIEVGGETFSQEEAIENLKQSKDKGNKCLTMFNALVAAKLNVIAGAESECVDETIFNADMWFANYCVPDFYLHASDPAWGMDGEPMYWTLDDYNNGLLCACPRD